MCHSSTLEPLSQLFYAVQLNKTSAFVHSVPYTINFLYQFIFFILLMGPPGATWSHSYLMMACLTEMQLSEFYT